MANSDFLNTIQHLREYETVVVHQRLTHIPEEEKQAVSDYLLAEYEREKTEYPHTPPEFDAEAAVWAAQVIYLIAQSILYRNLRMDELQPHLPVSPPEIKAPAIVSADLCLRFLPHLNQVLVNIDAEDELIPWSAAILHAWHYSAIRAHSQLDNLDFSAITVNPCLHQLYANRVAEFKNAELAKLPEIKPLIAANLGLHAPQLWPEFKAIETL